MEKKGSEQWESNEDPGLTLLASAGEGAPRVLYGHSMGDILSQKGPSTHRRSTFIPAPHTTGGTGAQQRQHGAAAKRAEPEGKKKKKGKEAPQEG